LIQPQWMLTLIATPVLAFEYAVAVFGNSTGRDWLLEKSQDVRSLRSNLKQ
jgi:hypothetical protein